MKQILLILIIINLSDYQAFSQSYAPFETGLPGYTQGGTSWGDFDNDGYLDLVINGLNEYGQTATQVYRNNAGQFTLAASLPGFFNGTVAWGDMDNDDDLDLLVCGADDSWNGNTAVYTNDNGNFTPLQYLFKGISKGKALWLDYNNDNFLDILITGDSYYYNPVVKLYKNFGSGIFEEVNVPFMPLLESFAAPGDYDNDGDQDILLAGDDGYGLFSTILYRNDNTIFVETPLFFDGVYSGDGMFLDYDKDHDLDIIYMGGIHGGLYIFRIYNNQSDGTFTKITNPIEGEWTGKIETADLNLDGYPDLGVTGSLCCGNALTAFYLNNGQGNFEHLNINLPPLTFSQLSFGDLDNDGDSDFILNGLPPEVGSMPFTKVYRNEANSNLFSPNNRPEAPTQLISTVTGNSVNFLFQMPEITYGGEMGYTYNLRIGTFPGGSDILSGLSNPETGFNKLFRVGNTGQNTSWSTQNLPDGTCYWSVQTIDLSGYASEFAPEQSFTITTTSINSREEKPVVKVFPAIFDEHITITGILNHSVRITDVNGKLNFTADNLEPSAVINTSFLPAGIYFLKVASDTYQETFKIIRH